MKLEARSTFAEIVRRWTPPDEQHTREQFVISLQGALLAGDDPLQIISYLRGFGYVVSTLEGLESAIMSLVEEEELSTEWATDGLVVHHASDGWLALFTASLP